MDLGLIEDDEHIYKIFYEACKIMLPYQLRKFFVWFLLAENIQGNMLCDMYKIFFSDDYKNNEEIEALNHIELLLNEESLEKNLENKKTIVTENFSILYNKLTTNQKNIFDKLINFPSDKLCFINVPGGTGNTTKFFSDKQYIIFK